MSEVVLDASALLAMLKEEPGGAKVAGMIASARMSMVNYAEVVSHFTALGMPPHDVDAMLDPLPLELVALDKATAQIAARLRALTAEAGLSLGDRCCLALATRDGLPAWTADKTWRTIADRASATVVVIR